MQTLLSDVRYREQNGKHLLDASISPFDPQRTRASLVPSVVFTQGGNTPSASSIGVFEIWSIPVKGLLSS